MNRISFVTLLVLAAFAASEAYGQKMTLMLQSAPAGPKRSNVSIYYKGLESGREYSPQDIAADWEGAYLATGIGSAYSVMAMLSNGRVGFAYEEKTYYPTSGAGYTIVYDAYGIEEITAGAYRLDEKAIRKTR